MFQGKPFTDVLGEIENGEFLAEVTEQLYNLVAACKDTRKPGSMTIKLGVKPTGKGTTVTVTAALATKEPEHDRNGTTFFVNDDFSLHRRDPNQQDLPLREVKDDAAPLKNVAE